MSAKTRQLAILAAILLLAITLRLIHSGSHSLWLDELFSLKFASLDLPGLLREVAGFDNHPPTYYLLLHGWASLFGDSELSLRLPSVIFSVLSVYFTYRVAERLFDRRVAVIAALLLAASAFSIYYAQEARMYSLLAMTTVLSVHFLLKLEVAATRTALFHYTWSTLLLLYTHLYGVFVLLAENLYVLLVLARSGYPKGGLDFRRWMAAQAAVLVLALPWFALLLRRVVSIDEEGFWTRVPDMQMVWKTLVSFSGSSIAAAVFVTLILLGLFSIFLHARERQEKDKRAAGLLLLLIAVPVMVPFVISQFMTPIYIIRSAIVAQFAFFVLVARGVAAVEPRWLHRLILLLLAVVMARPLLVEGYVHYRTPQYREAAAHIAVHAGSGDVIAACRQRHLAWPLRHYLQRTGVQVDAVQTVDDGASPVLAPGQRLWLVRRTDSDEDCSGLIGGFDSPGSGFESASTRFSRIEVWSFIPSRGPDAAGGDSRAD